MTKPSDTDRLVCDTCGTVIYDSRHTARACVNYPICRGWLWLDIDDATERRLNAEGQDRAATSR